MHIPNDAVRRVLDAPEGTARIMANRVKDSPTDNPSLVIIANALATVSLLDCLRCGVEHAPTADMKDAWKGATKMLLEALMGELT